MTGLQPTMTAEEARACVDRIRSGLENIRVLVLDLYERQGWRVLGYGSWRECVTAEFEKSQAYLYRVLAAGQVEQAISPMGEIGVIPERQARELSRLKEPELIRETWQERLYGVRIDDNARHVGLLDIGLIGHCGPSWRAWEGPSPRLSLGHAGACRR